jgi:hypothetical protein
VYINYSDFYGAHIENACTAGAGGQYYDLGKILAKKMAKLLTIFRLGTVIYILGKDT